MPEDDFSPTLYELAKRVMRADEKFKETWDDYLDPPEAEDEAHEVLNRAVVAYSPEAFGRVIVAGFSATRRWLMTRTFAQCLSDYGLQAESPEQARWIAGTLVDIQAINSTGLTE